MSESECLEDRLLRERTLAVDQALGIAYQVAEFFTVAHAAGLMHGALFPSAIVVAGSGKASVDFDSPRCGPRPQDAKPADDVSGLGGVIYRMLCGQPPNELLPISVLRPEAPEEIATLATSMMASEPSARPTMADVARQLAPFYTLPDPDDEALAELRMQLEQYKQMQQWEKAIETVMQLLDLESDPVCRAKLSSEAAEISRDQLLDPDNAVEYFDHAIDAYFMADVANDAVLSAATDAFRSLERILTENSRWLDLDRAYRRMIYRLKSEGSRLDKLQAEMLANLGDLYRSRLGMESAADSAFEQARKLEPILAAHADLPGERLPAIVTTSGGPGVLHEVPSWSDDPRMNDPIGLGLGPPVDTDAPAKTPDIALLQEQLTHEHYSLRFQAWDALIAAFGLESVVRAPRGQSGKGSYMELLKDFLASDCKAFVRMGVEEIRTILDKLSSGASPASLGIEWQLDERPAVTERMVEAMLDPQRAYPVEEIATLTGLPRRWAEASLAFGVEKGDERVIDALVQLGANWTVPILEELAASPTMPSELRDKLKQAVRDLKAS